MAGAIKATGGAGLQPAMDHILANEGSSVPDLSSVSSSGPARARGDDDDDDEDGDASRAIIAAGGDPTAQEARVRHALSFI